MCLYTIFKKYKDMLNICFEKKTNLKFSVPYMVKISRSNKSTLI